MTRMLYWVTISWSHFWTFYGIGWAIFTILAVLFWGFVYRPSARGEDTANSIWSNDETVGFAFLQGMFWPISIGVYASCVVAGGLILGLATIGEKVANILPPPNSPRFKRSASEQFKRLM